MAKTPVVPDVDQPKKEKIILTQIQKDLIVSFWNERKDSPPSLPEIVQKVFNEPDIDSRSSKGRAVREFLANNSMEQSKDYIYKPKGLIELTEEQKEYIANNCSTMLGLQLARNIFNNNDLTNTHQEARTVYNFIKTLDQKTVLPEIMEEEYRPPKTEDHTVARVNKYVQDALDRNKLTPRQKKDMVSLRGYLHSHKFINQINSYSDLKEKELFESDFVKFIYDKSDLTFEELDLYILLCIEGIRSLRIQKRAKDLQLLWDESMEEMREEPDKKKRSFNMVLVEGMATIETEYNQTVRRQRELTDALVGKRSDRLSNQLKATASILNLVELWKFKEDRDKIIQEGEKRKVGIQEELDHLGGMDRLKAQIFGVTEEESLN